jgi:hypothetical protein
VDGDSIAAVADTFATAQGGSVTLAANGTFTYTPAANFNGSDSFSYTITDGTLTSTATVTLTVTDVNDLPTATASTSSGNEDTDIAVSAVGTDIDGTIASWSRSPACRRQAKACSILPTARRRSPGGYADHCRPGRQPHLHARRELQRHRHDPVHRHRQRRRHQCAGQRGDHGCRRQRPADGDGVPDLRRQRRHQHRGRLGGTDVDGTIATVTVTSLPPASEGVLYLSDGTTPVVAGTPITAAQAANLIFTPAANFNGTVTIPFTVTDDDGGTSAPANEVITVTPVNDAPTAVANSYTTNEDTSVSGNVLTDDTGAGTDSDIDGDSITAVAGTFATVQGGTVTLAANGTFTYTPAANFNGSDSFSVHDHGRHADVDRDGHADRHRRQ